MDAVKVQGYVFSYLTIVSLAYSLSCFNCFNNVLCSNYSTFLNMKLYAFPVIMKKSISRNIKTFILFDYIKITLRNGFYQGYQDR